MLYANLFGIENIIAVQAAMKGNIWQENPILVTLYEYYLMCNKFK